MKQQIFITGTKVHNQEVTVKKSPWHSIKAGVHHVCSNCNTGNNIETENIRTGTGGKPLCQECKGLIASGGC